ncbi:MAG TPA: ABC transporter permease [Terriglobales bacterium]|nr:ABC transporter permease [Terriglobales bacterium]
MLNELRYALRMLLKTPGFTAVAVLTLALGIGANTAIFSVVNAVLLRPLPFKDPERLVTVWERNPKVGYDQNTVGPATYHDWRTQNQVFEQVAAIGWVKRANLTGEGMPVRVTTITTSANLFPMMGVAALLGREFAKEEETPGRDRVVILSHGLWTQHYGSDPGIAGKTILLDGIPHTVIGVMPRGFVYPGGTGMLFGFLVNPPADVWVPLALSSEALTRDRDSHDLQVLTKLKTGVALEQARDRMDDLMQRIERANPGDMGTHCALVPLQEQSVGSLRLGLLVLWGAVGFVLLIACVNVANLLLARAAGRQREIAIRVALGAGRRQIVRQLLSESVLLAVLSALLGTLLALWMVLVLTATVGENVAKTTPGWTNIGIDWEVLAFTVTLAVSTGILFGLAPAWRAGRTDVNACLKAGGRGSAEGVGHHRLRSMLVIAEMAMAMVLLVGAGLMVRSLIRLQRVDPGLNPAGVLTFELCIPNSKFSDTYQRWLFLERLLERLKRVPGIAFAGATTGLPLEFMGGNTSFEIVGQPKQPGKFEGADNWAITPDYLRSMQIRLIAGRPFESRDNKDAPLVCLIDQTLARRHFPNENPVGRRIRLGFGGSPREIVGVVASVKNRVLDSSLLPAPLRAPSLRRAFMCPTDRCTGAIRFQWLFALRAIPCA